MKIKSETVLLALQPFLSFLMHLFCAELAARLLFGISRTELDGVTVRTVGGELLEGNCWRA